MFLRSLASGRGSFVRLVGWGLMALSAQRPDRAIGSFVKTASVVPDGFEVAVDSELSTRPVWHDRKHIINFRSVW